VFRCGVGFEIQQALDWFTANFPSADLGDRPTDPASHLPEKLRRSVPQQDKIALDPDLSVIYLYYGRLLLAFLEFTERDEIVFADQ